MAKFLSWLTLAGLLMVVLAIFANLMEVPYPFPITLLCLGAACSLLAGIPWAHTRGRRGLKAAFLGLVGYAGGAALGLLLGATVAPSNILLMIFGWWVGGILFGSLGVWWGLRIHRQ